jgi:hypothetical protein
MAPSHDRGLAAATSTDYERKGYQQDDQATGH